MKRTAILLIGMLCASSAMMAQDRPRYEGMRDVNHVVDNTADSLEKANQVRPVSGSSRKGSNPVIFLVGNSTMRNGTLGNGNNGQWGWGYFERLFWDERKITVENHALGGMSTRTFYRDLWPAVLKGVQKGDYVFLELGHNDNGPLDSGRARSCIKGVGHDSTLVTIKETGRQEMVYTFGGYIRKYVAQIRAKGATPVLFTLTPRNDYEPDDPTRIQRKLADFTPWIKAMAQELNCAMIDLNDISATKLEKYGRWKTNYFFFGDKIHSSEFGARMNAASCAEGIEACTHPDVALLKTFLKQSALHPERIDKGRQPGKPVVFTTGDSTMKNTDSDANGMWGWGAVATSVFDETKCTVINAGMAGRSTRTFLDEGRWDKVYNSLEPGDYVLIQFGHNDIGGIDRDKERGVIASAADTCHVYHLQSNGQYKVVYSFGWYLKKFIQDVREKGATPILLSLTPRNEWPGGKIERRNDTYGRWYREVAAETGVEFVDVHNITADYFDSIGREATAPYYKNDHTHTSRLGALRNAQSVADGLRQIDSPLAKYLK
ncbi:MAG: rhamnogalacturonan acetylesterase [Bacteroidaceae bacterium]|nr:rhamnogalacturonan acetylesterase [Bacteroidaceae bacterium]